MSAPSASHTSPSSLIQDATLAWAQSQASKLPPSAEAISSSPDSIVDLRGIDGPTALKRWITTAIQHQQKEARIGQLRLRPIANMIRNDASADDGPSVISVARSFGLSTTTGARGDAVSYVLNMNGDQNSGGCSIHGVVKVIKSQSTFQQELAALTLIHAILPSPAHANYPRAIDASWAYIPTSIPIGSDGSSSFARPYSVSSLSSSTAGSTASTDANFCQGGLLLMECAPGQPLAQWFKLVASSPIGGSDRKRHLDELSTALTAAARALSELHQHSSIESTPSDASPFIEETARQMKDMLGKLALDQYAETKKKWNINVETMTVKMKHMQAQVLKDAGGQANKESDNLSSSAIRSALIILYFSRLMWSVTCVIHGDAHAGNMLWDVDQQRLTLIDLPTMLAATKVESMDDETQRWPKGKFRLGTIQSPGTSPIRHSAACPHPSSLVLHGTALAGRDVCHFERKLDSFGSQAGMEPDEVTHMKDTFHREYIASGGRITDAATNFFEYRSLLGEVTQLVRHDPQAIKPRIVEQMQEILKRNSS